MQAMLEKLNGVPGVLGSMLCDGEGRVLASALPPDLGPVEAAEAAAAMAESSRDLGAVAGRVGLLDYHYAQRRMLVRPAGEGHVLLLCEKGVSPAAVTEVLRGFQEAASPPPRPPPARPLQAAPVPAAPPPISRRTLLLAGGGALALVVLVGLLSWRAAQSGPAAAPAAVAARPPGAAEAQVVLRVGGAKSFAAELAPALAEAYLISLGAREVSVKRRDSHRFQVEGSQDGARIAVAVEGMNTPQGFEELASGNLDVAMSGRRIKADWQEKLAAFGPMAVPGREHVVALSGVAVVVNQANTVPQLDRQQLAAIFSGAVTDWSAVRGGAQGGGSPVHVYATDDKMGLTDLFRTFVLEKTPYANQARRVASLQEMNDAVAQDPQGIGFLTLPFVRGTRAVPVSEGDEPPLVPTAFTLATEDYFLTHRLYFYVVPRPANPHLLRFVQFALGPEGQAVVKKSGYVELSVAAAQREPPAGAPAEYLRITAGARRLTSTFRFEVASSDFDARALRDLDRVTAYLVENRLNGASVRVLGFADAQGKREPNIVLSLARAEQVVKALAQRGIAGITVRGFGPDLPVASNGNAEGRQRNRRVEIWVSPGG